jgi:CheY-like chemotaxis protein
MTAILGWARLLPSLSPGDDVFNEAVAAIGRSAQLQARLIDDVLDVSRIISGKLRLTRETFDVAQLLRASMEAVQPMADARSVTLKASFAPGLGELVADPTRIQQVVWNLLTNAIKFTPKQGTVELRAQRTSSHIQIEVCDTGEGIDSNFLAHVFEPFRQAESPRTRVHGGLGLGLSIVRYLTEAHGGTVSAESAGRGRGATFNVTLPITAVLFKPVPEQRPVESDLSVSVAGRLAGHKILIVDDDRETRDLVRAVLLQAGANVIAVESGPAALDHFDQDHPDIILTDVAMPGMDGYEFARTVRKRQDRAAVKIIALTAFPAGTQAAEVSGFDDYLTKPMEPSDLVEAIVRVAARPK